MAYVFKKFNTLLITSVKHYFATSWTVAPYDTHQPAFLAALSNPTIPKSFDKQDPKKTKQKI